MKAESIARNCANWHDGECEICGVPWQYQQVGGDYRCPHFKPRPDTPTIAAIKRLGTQGKGSE